MLIEVRVPALSESVAEATLLSWHKQQGDYVKRDENLIDIETDKVVLELPAPQAGVLIEIIKEEGGLVGANEIIARIDTSAIDNKENSSTMETGKKVTPEVQAGKTESGVVLMPAARKLAAEKNVSAQAVSGTGRGGRITKEDVVAASVATTSGNAGSLSASKAAVDVKGRSEQRVPMSRLRQRVAERLLESQATAAILTTFNEVNMQPVIDIRNKYKVQFEKEHGVKLGFMSFFVKAVVAALKKYPIVNASVDGDDIVYHGYFDVGMAVGSPRGLVVPIIRNADTMAFSEIEKAIGDFGKRAQEGRLSIDELTGGTFSISNGGVFGSMLSTPIINPPQSAILGIHATKDRAVVEDGQIVVRPMNYLALSYDHRIIDGREAVLFLVAIKEALEDPSRLLLEI
ncbi:2-oxoglutarate dehydrogenase complex dihydrolipoyllysine-residue succinyltransferase [Burkholderiales bacterium]|jgi:2-oxoglutarate dehydrogenase E2 component (dihydrolipoamide succinyltransferase)|nr:2-oxoglutarate dehydrogenase complex dihydrolipoyllysine-residue succinyltransferase [Burkholderiales bacterium]HAT51773.1 dihydrolipoamide succinyltransferase [Betaproteobacteria bacterium]HAU82604.1 dihydrolipoamide succinyltransferase [Betaproteobacteria bacterium]